MCVSLNGTYLCTVCTAVCLRLPESCDNCSPVLATLQYTHASLFSSMLVERGLKADEWVKALTPLLGGKAGGKDTSAQGSGINTGVCGLMDVLG